MIRLHKGIVFRSILTTLLAFLVASIGSIAYSVYATGERASQTIDTRLNQLLDTVQSTVKIACFLDDKDLAREVARGLLSNSEVLRVTIKTASATLADEIRHDAPPESAGNKLALLERKMSSPFNTRETVGEVVLTPNPAAIASLRNEDIILAVKQLTWQLAFVSIVIIIALIIFFVRPISRISQALHMMDPTSGDRLAVPPGHADTEIGRLVGDVNELADHLVAAIEEARDARVVAETASSAKSAFLANMSHEIRTPISAVLGLARIGARDSNEPATRATFDRIIDAGTHLLGVINDILDFSKIEAGKLAITIQPMRLADMIAEVVALVTPRASEKSLVLTTRPSPNLPTWVSGDSMRIRQILVNLLANAIKFTPHGKIDLNILREGDEIWFAVSDAGIGMTPEETSRLFLPFEQADNSTTRKYGGTGLGLAISMNLASLMGGGIQVVSKPGQGSTFTLHLPLKETAAPPETERIPKVTADAGQRLTGIRILAAEDIDVNRLILEDLLVEAGASCIFAENGRIAVEQVAATPDAFDIVLMDVQMPEMDGHEATRRIREISPSLPVIGLTAYALIEEREKCIAAGMVDHVTKPIDPALLVATIMRWVKPQDCIMEPTAPSAAVLPAPTFEEPLPDNSSEVDWPKLEQRFKGKPALIRKLAQAMIDSHADSPARLRRLATEKDFSALVFLAHSLKGTTGNLAATSTQALAETLEVAARQQDDRSASMAAELATSLEKMLDELRQATLAQ